jgi:peptide deformylase
VSGQNYVIFREVRLNNASNPLKNQSFMAILNILQYPDPRLYTKAKPVDVVDAQIRRLIDDMAETMYQAPGIGLAATQIDQHIQLLVIDTSEEKNQLQTFINPRIISTDGMQDYEEGCLSVPGIYESVSRPERLVVEALDYHGNPFSLEAEGLLAVCIQHEMDHLKGKVFVEYLSQPKQVRIKNKMKKRQRDAR